MARIESTIGVFSDLVLGTGSYAHSSATWVGDPTPGVTASTISVLYRIGDVVVHDEIIYIARRDNDNATPGTDELGFNPPMGDTVSPWTIIGSTATPVTPTPPLRPRTGTQWLNNTNGRTYIYNGNAWVQTSGLEIVNISGRNLDGGGLQSATLQTFDGGTDIDEPFNSEIDGGGFPFP